MRTIRAICIGTSESGKTCLLRILRDKKDNMCINEFMPTVGIDFMSIRLRHIRLLVWDTSGQPKFDSAVSTFLPDTDIVLYAFDSSSIASLKYAIRRYNSIRRDTTKARRHFLIATKSDLKVRLPQLIDVLKRYPELLYFETSAYHPETILNAFRTIESHVHDESEETNVESPELCCCCVVQ